jgi:hypothetical protein
MKSECLPISDYGLLVASGLVILLAITNAAALQGETHSGDADADAHLAKQRCQTLRRGKQELTWKPFELKKAAEDYYNRRRVDVSDGAYRDIKY